MVRNVSQFTLYSALLLTFIASSNALAFDKLTATVDKNPAMLDDMESYLETRSMKRHRSKSPGQIVLERYW